MPRSLAAALFALSPWVVGGLGLAALRPAPLASAPDRELLLGAGDDAAAVAREFPGRATVAVGSLPELDLGELPFDRLLLTPGVEMDPTVFGFAPAGDPGAGRLFVRPRRWTLLDSWTRWQAVAERPGNRVPCDRRLQNGGYGCGGGLQIAPDVARSRGRLTGVVRVTAVPPGSALTLTVPEAPAGIAGWAEPRGKGPVRLLLSRGSAEAPTLCVERCALVVPPGEGPLEVRIPGPSRELTFTLFEAAP